MVCEKEAQFIYKITLRSTSRPLLGRTLQVNFLNAKEPMQLGIHLYVRNIIKTAIT